MNTTLKAFLIAIPIMIPIIFVIVLVTQPLTHPELTGTSDISTANVIAPPDATEVENRVNAYRSEKGLPLLKDNAVLDQAAAVRADGMCAANDWSHAKDWEVLNPYYSYAYAGENLYYGYLQKDQAAEAVRAWIASPSHREAMVADYTEFGIAVKYCPGFQGDPTAVIITNYFGVPR